MIEEARRARGVHLEHLACGRRKVAVVFGLGEMNDGIALGLKRVRRPRFRKVDRHLSAPGYTDDVEIALQILDGVRSDQPGRPGDETPSPSAPRFPLSIRHDGSRYNAASE